MADSGLSVDSTSEILDLAIVGAGAAGLATAIFAAQRNAGWSIAALDGAKKLGAKILVSGGGRCNVTNAIVEAADFRGGSRNVIRRVLSAFPAERAAAFFREIGVELHEEEHGKLFPDSNKARTVLEALVREADVRGVRLWTGHRVTGVERMAMEGVAGAGLESGFEISLATDRSKDLPTHAAGELGAAPPRKLRARRVVLATGGLSLPKTGSDGAGYGLAKALGHTVIATTPALAPLILEGDFHGPLSGVAHEVELTVRVESEKPAKLTGSMLWTHFGVSGPVVLDASGLWHRARLEGRDVRVSVSFIPGLDAAAAERRLIEFAAAQPRATVQKALAVFVPVRVAEAMIEKLRGEGRLSVDGQVAMAHLPREERRRLVQALLEWPLEVRDSRGYAFAEVTAGGVPLSEIDPATMESRKCAGLYFVGEVLDVDGRIGGFNFQWSWSSAWVAAAGMASATSRT